MKKVLTIILLFFIHLESTNALKIVSLGDSINEGYMLIDNNKSFDNMFADTIDAEIYEHSHLGMRSDDLLKDLNHEDLKENIKNADIVIINIGANDLLDLFDYADLSKVGIKIEYGSIPHVDLNYKFINNLKTYLQEFVTKDIKPMTNKAISDFSVTFPIIIKKIREYNPNSTIVVNNLYNPFFNISISLLSVDLSAIEKEIDEVINSFNSIIDSDDNYIVIDVHSTLRNNKYLNVNPLTFSFDPHPNIEGHKRIYELYLQELCYKISYEGKDYYALKNSPININPKKKMGYTFLKWNYDLNNIKSDIELKAIYKFNYTNLLVLIILPLCLLVVKRNKK